MTSNTEYIQATVVDPVVDADGNDQVNISYRGGTILGCYLANSWALQRGDSVTVAVYGERTKQYLVVWAPKNRLVIPSIPSIKQVPPSWSDGSYSQMGSVWAKTGTNPVTDLVLVQSSAPPAPTSGTVKVPANGSATWDPSNRWFDSLVRQGSWGSGGNYGLWFYPAIPPLLPSGVAIKGATVHIHRTQNEGQGRALQLHLFLHNYAAQPTDPTAPTVAAGPRDVATATPSPNATCDPQLPDEFVAALVAGSQLGLAIFAPDPASYLACMGPDRDPLSGQITFTY